MAKEKNIYIFCWILVLQNYIFNSEGIFNIYSLLDRNFYVVIPFFFNLEGILDIYLLLDRNFYVVIPFSLSSLSTLLSLDIMVMGFKDVQLRAQDLMGSARGFILADKSVKKDFIKENKRQMLQFLFFFPPPIFEIYKFSFGN